MVTKWWTLTAYPAAAYRGQLAQLEQQYSSSWRWLSLLADGCPEIGYLFRTCRLNTIKILYVLNCLKNSVKDLFPSVYVHSSVVTAIMTLENRVGLK